ncbi:CehA/McbA family metallohydrolase [Stieleria mannarensis]|uniref:CehA/McbA family metallohydrolase n=1 Tax=Stieleria mannarensis TaxID=2755585 RepID=UPI001604798A|nr:CehA/McbA family metallohydrolase [Rhodopirellula sp. JC639]
MNAPRKTTSPVLLSIGIAICLLQPARLASGQDDLAIVHRVPKQPLLAATARLIEAMQFAGSPLDDSTLAAIQDADKLGTPAEVSRAIQSALDPLCLAAVHINAESRVKVTEGPVKKQLMQQGWRAFLVKVHNEAGITPELVVDSPNAAPVYQKGRGARQRPRSDEDLVDPNETEDRWLDLSMLNRAPLKKQLSGLNLEYRVVMLGSRDAGKREANIAFNVGQGTQDIGFRNSVAILFDCQSAVDVQLGIIDVDGQPTTASLLITDDQGRVYPNPAKRLAPDFFFHHQVYRADGESLLLPPGEYNVSVTRGPEYVPIRRRIRVPDIERHQESFQLKRWIHMAKRRWYSGDHHVHAAGCAHYDSPTEGVGPEDMMRHLLGEDVNVGCVLSWGPCWYTQKEFFNGQTSALSTEDNLMRYDVEVSGFPSSHAGHLCLLNLSEDDYPGTNEIEDWPSWTLPVLQWGKQQGGVVGYSHSGWGLALPDTMPDGSRKFVGRPWGGAKGDWRGKAADALPDFAMPKFDGIGANEYIVTVAEDACDFISAVDTPAIWELNIWYHTLNCGMTARISGETDFPCIYGDRVGLGRIYVQLDEDQPLDYENWIAGLKDGRSYCGDGLSHIIDFAVDGLGVGQKQSADTKPSRLDLKRPDTVNVTFDVAALLKETPTKETERIRKLRMDEKPYWHIERCRLGDSRRVPVEVIVNGEVVDTRQIIADGSVTSHSIPVQIDQSSWVAVRILPSVHTNPVFVHVADKPIRANRKSAQWCIDAVAACWNSKRGQIRESERSEAKAAYDRAAERYRTILAESSN